ncbi:MAG: HD family phosphohydrolase [Rubrobacteraceae bacterium]|jgi:putative nucleotidyltransferase with HDIG domain|nr:HDIG domain-containing protein [Rubrobacter sp.]
MPLNDKSMQKVNGKRVDEFHRPPTAFERFRAWVDGLPRLKLYVALVGVTWLALTAIIGLDSSHLSAVGLRAEPGYQAGDIASRDEFASRAVSYENPAATEEARNQASGAVAEIYQQSDTVPQQVEDGVWEFFDRVRDLRQSDTPEDEKVARVSDTSPFFISDDVARALIFIPADDLDDVERYVSENLEELYTAAIVAEDSVMDIPPSAIRLTEARNRLSESADSDASGEVGLLTEALSRGFLQPSYVIDRQATEGAREAAVAQVEPVQITVQPGERIIARGEVIDRESVAQLEALGKIRDTNPWTVLLGISLVVAAQLGIAWYFLERFGRRLFKSKVAIRLLLAASLMVLFTLMARAFVLLSFNAYLIPLAGLSILGTILLGPRLMFLMVVVSSINVGVIAGNDFLLAAALLISSGFAIYTVVRVDSREQLLRAGLIITLVTGAVTFAISLVGGSTMSVALWQGVLGLGNGALSLMLAMVLLPLLENAFNLLTPMKLLELSDPGAPLLQKLLRKTPGTFSHSMQVGVMAETAADRIGADTLLARVGAYYHDVGKMEHPGYFIENQIAQMNPHENLSPALSAKIIKRHVKDGVEIGRAWGLPEEIVSLISEHHGTTRIEYFYRKALEESGEGAVRESDFRYSSGRPKSKESGILMLADTVEATVRSLPKPTPKRIEDIIRDTISRKLDDGQFDDCELTLREIHEVGEAIREAVIGFLGPRIEYPEPESKPSRQAAKPAARNPK